MSEKQQNVRNVAAVFLSAITLTLGVLALIRSVNTIGKPFSGFFYGPNLLVSITQRASWPGITQGLKSLEKVISVEGRKLSEGGELQDIIRHSKPGTYLNYKVLDRGGKVRSVSIPVITYTLNDFLVGFLAPFLLGLLFLFFGVVLYFAQQATAASFVYLALSCVISAFCMTIFEAYTSFTFFRVTLFYPMIGALSAHLFSLFPAVRMTRKRVKFAVIVLYLLAFILVAERQININQAEVSAWLSKFSTVYVLIVLAVDALLLARGYQFAVHEKVRDRVKVIGIGLLIACSVIALWSLNFLRISQPFYLDEGVLLASFFPIFMAYAVLRKNVFNLDRVIRLTLSYGIATAAVLSLYLLVVGSIRVLAPGLMESRFSIWLFAVMAAFGAYLFNSLRKKINQWVHRVIFKSKHDLFSILSDIDRSLTNEFQPGMIIEKIERLIFEGLAVQRGAIVLLENEVQHQPVVRFWSWKEPPNIADHWISLFTSENFLVKLESRPDSIEVAEFGNEYPEQFIQTLSLLRAHHIEWVVPIRSPKRLYGFMLLGKKLSNEDFDIIDLELLNSVTYRLGIILENSDLARGIENQARLAALGKMSSIIIHDIKNPLSAIRTAAGSLKKKFLSQDSGFELSQIILSEVDRMNRTIAEILTYAKPAGLSLSVSSMNDLVEESVKSFRSQFEQAQVEIRLKLTSDDTSLMIDRDLVQRAIENLLNNALEASQPGGKVVIRTDVSGKDNGHSKLKLTIEDTGRGMEPKVREKVFEPFYTTKPQGTGLGLALVKQIVHQHQGEIELETRVGSGTTFVLSFPLWRKDPPYSS